MPLETIAKTSELDSGTYVWSVPGAPVRVHVQIQVVQGIDEYIKQIVPGTQSGAVQKIGILLGNVKAPRGPRITGFKPITSIRSTDMEEVLTTLRNNESGEEPVGYFRTHSESRLCLSAADITLAEDFFFGPACVFLLINYSAEGSAKAGFFFWDHGHLNGDFCFLEFPFSVSALSVKPNKTVPASPPQASEARRADRKALSSGAPYMLPSEVSLDCPFEQTDRVPDPKNRSARSHLGHSGIGSIFSVFMRGSLLHFRNGLSFRSLTNHNPKASLRLAAPLAQENREGRSSGIESKVDERGPAGHREQPEDGPCLT